MDSEKEAFALSCYPSTVPWEDTPKEKARTRYAIDLSIRPLTDPTGVNQIELVRLPSLLPMPINNRPLPDTLSVHDLPVLQDFAFLREDCTVIDKLDAGDFVIYAERLGHRDVGAKFWERILVGHMLEQLAPEKLLLCRLDDETRLSATSPSTLADPGRLLLRFCQSMFVNTANYVLPLLRAALGPDADLQLDRTDGVKAITVRVSWPPMPENRKKIMLSEVCRLGFLFNFHILHDASPSQLRSAYEAFQNKVSGADISRFYDGQMVVGTRKYLPRKGRLYHGLKTFADLGLIEFDHDARTVLHTEAGRNFRSMLPRTSFDPDIDLRWVIDETENFDPSCAENIDKWVENHFGALRKAAIKAVG